jgi:Beta-ketoacyl synthase, N-terminal domain
MRPAWVMGIGLWTPGFPTVEAWSARRQEPSAVRPACDILNPRIGRYCSLVTRMAIEAFTQAGRQAQADLSKVASVFGSAYGEIRIAFEQLEMIRQEGVPSPARFKNSVHNTASGHVSIATGSTGFSTALAAGRATFAMSLLEAWLWLEAHGGEVIVCVADEPLPDFLSDAPPYPPLGVAFHLRAEPAAAALGRVSAMRRAGGPAVGGGFSRPWAGNPCAAALTLVEAIAGKRSGTVPLELGDPAWCADLEIGAGAAP